jgi:acyl-CoA reductase-like NAD-dependent aldehyde dehydrogenase
MNKVVDTAQSGFNLWRQTPLRDRIQILDKFVTALVQNNDEIVKELALMIKRPLKQNYNEIRGFEERARYMISIAEEALKDVQVPEKEGFIRKISKEPIGVVFIIGAWNYPYLTTVNSLIPALLAGDSVILKHAPQTFDCADQYAKALKAAGLPDGVFTAVRIDHVQASEIMKDKRIRHVQFTGSERGGKEISALLASHNFTASVSLELGGNDAAYVRSDADLDSAAENIVDGAFYNSGQSCCGIQRVYVHSSLYNDFVKKAIAETIVIL